MWDISCTMFYSNVCSTVTFMRCRAVTPLRYRVFSSGERYGNSSGVKKEKASDKNSRSIYRRIFVDHLWNWGIWCKLSGCSGWGFHRKALSHHLSAWRVLVRNGHNAHVTHQSCERQTAKKACNSWRRPEDWHSINLAVKAPLVKRTWSLQITAQRVKVVPVAPKWALLVEQRTPIASD
jgi:hypothetical protein